MARSVKTVFILGAGASQPTGTPVMANFIDYARDLYSLGSVSDAEDSFKCVFDAISNLHREVHSKARIDGNNIETLFEVIEMGKTLCMFPGIDRDKIDSLSSAVKILISRTITGTQKFHLSPDNRPFAPKIYSEFASVLNRLRTEAKPSHATSVITFNYDVGLDLALEEQFGNNLDYGLAGNPGGYKLLKLHGSLLWAKDADKIISFSPGAYIAPHPSWGGYAHDRTLLWDTSKVLRNNKYQEPFIVPPAWNKTEYQRLISPVWANAASELSQAENIVIIGYSMPPSDGFFKHLYALGSAGGTALRKFEIFDKSSAVEDRFRELIGPGVDGRLNFTEGDFQRSISKIFDILTSKG